MAYMSEVNLYKVIAPYVNLFKADLSFSKLDLINFEHADLSRVNLNKAILGNDSNLLIVFYVQIMPDDFVMQLHRF